MPLACSLPEVAYIKNFVSIPVFCAGRMENPDTAAEAIEGGKIDGIGVSRQFLADPEWLNKVRDGKVDDIRPCIACHNGCFPVRSETCLQLSRSPITPLTLFEYRKNKAPVGFINKKMRG